MQTVIDVHCHLGQSVHGSMSADGARLCVLARQAGVTHAVAFSIEACYGGIDVGNAYTLSEVHRHAMLSAMVVAHPHHRESSARWVHEGVANPDVVGVKLHPALGQYEVNSSAMMRLMDEVIAPSGLPVLSHVGNETAQVPIDKYLDLASRYPDVRFIAAHLGVGLLGIRERSVDAWRERPLENVWFDMGTLRAFTTGAVEGLLEVVGEDRICFGTDAPLYVPAPFTRLLETLDISDEAREKIAYRNALTVLPRLAGKAGTGATQ